MIVERDNLRAELAALKARRCDECKWYRPPFPYRDDTKRWKTGDCSAYNTFVRPDHACNSWAKWMDDDQ